MVRMIKIFFIICALVSRGFTQFDPQLTYFGRERIVGGIPINIEVAPYQVSVQKDGSHLCGGSIIDKNWVLTAGHCMIKKHSSHSISVRLGSAERDRGGDIIPVKQIITHELYDDDTTDYDFSLLKLKYPIRFRATKLKVGLPEQDEPVKEGTLGMVSGWGNTQTDGESSLILLGVLLPIVNQVDCQNANGDDKITDRMICAGYKKGGKDACQGDSGGPFVADHKLIGVVSWGNKCALPEYPGVFSRVASVRDWIRNKTNI